ncbi:MAG: hypothetical protein ABEJ86_07515 [Halococcoides sp.]
MTGHRRPIYLDATVLSNFASTDAIDSLVAILDAPTVVPAVRDEIERGHDLGHAYLTNAIEAFDDGLSIGTVPADGGEPRVRERLDAGEADALLGALDAEGTLATDDLAARRLASDLSVPVTGSIGILVMGIERDQIDRDQADAWLHAWRETRGYYAPVESVSAVLDDS